ncbi:MAG: IclR family transcriptional regulator [Hyphomonadaceae bacterium]
MAPRKIAAAQAPAEKVIPPGLGLIKSIDKAVAIMQALYAAHRPLRVSEIAAQLSLSQSVVSRIVSTLCETDILEQDEETGRVRLGLGLMLLGHASLAHRKVDYIAFPILARLYEQFEGYISVARLVRGRVVLVRAGPAEALERETYLTTIVPVHATAAGKLLTAWESVETLEEIFRTYGMDPHTPRTITSMNRFQEELAKARAEHFAIDDEELVVGLRHIATPVFDHEGKIVAALSAGGVLTQMSDTQIAHIRAALTGAAMQISRQMGFSAMRPHP